MNESSVCNTQKQQQLTRESTHTGVCIDTKRKHVSFWPITVELIPYWSFRGNDWLPSHILDIHIKSGAKYTFPPTSAQSGKTSARTRRGSFYSARTLLYRLYRLFNIIFVVFWHQRAQLNCFPTCKVIINWFLLCGHIIAYTQLNMLPANPSPRKEKAVRNQRVLDWVEKTVPDCTEGELVLKRKPRSAKRRITQDENENRMSKSAKLIKPDPSQPLSPRKFYVPSKSDSKVVQNKYHCFMCGNILGSHSLANISLSGVAAACHSRIKEKSDVQLYMRVAR